MNKVLIKNVLKNKLNIWLSTIQDKNVRNTARDSVFVSGGAILSLLTGEKINDYDCYFTTLEAAEAVTRYYVDVFNKENTLASKVKEIIPEVVVENGRIRIVIQSAGVATCNSGEVDYEYFECGGNAEEYIGTIFKSDKRNTNEGYVPLILTDNAVTLSKDIQLIHRFYGAPDEVHRNFDFSNVTNYYSLKEDELVLRKEALESIVLKRLVYVGSYYPVATLFRLRKYLKKGWDISAGQILKIALQVNSLDLKDPKVLSEQIMGVDIAYMKEILEKIDKENIDSTYLASLIDEVFDG